MSWSIATKKPVSKKEIDAEINNLALPEGYTEGPATDQLRIAKQAARLIVSAIPGPYINISLNGHANGVGWQQKSGWANDAINVSVSQICEDDLKYYQN